MLGRGNEASAKDRALVCYDGEPEEDDFFLQLQLLMGAMAARAQSQGPEVELEGNEKGPEETINMFMSLPEFGEPENSFISEVETKPDSERAPVTDYPPKSRIKRRNASLSEVLKHLNYGSNKK